MNTEIRKEIREYILNDVNLTLSRFGISKDLELVRESVNRDKSIDYVLCASNIKQFPVMFKELDVDGRMWSMRVNEGDRFYREGTHLVAVRLGYSYKHFGGGSNGCDIGTILYMVNDDLPNSFDGCLYSPEYYVRKVKSLEI